MSGSGRLCQPFLKGKDKGGQRSQDKRENGKRRGSVGPKRPLNGTVFERKENKEKIGKGLHRGL